MKTHTISLFVPQREPALVHCIREVFDAHGIKYLINPTPAQEKQNGQDAVLLQLVSPHNRQEIFSDVLLYDTMSEKDDYNAEALNHIHFDNLLIINGDLNTPPSFAVGMTAYPITYGLNQKCSLTVSSIDRSEGLKLTCCLQRNIASLNGQVIEPQEICVQVREQNANIYDALAACCLVLALM